MSRPSAPRNPSHRSIPLLFIAAAAMVIPAGCMGVVVPGSSVQPASVTSKGWAPDCSIRTADWGDLCTARASHIASGWQQEISTAVNPTDPANVIIGSKEVYSNASERCVWNGLAVTKDGGKTWTDVHIGGASFADRTPSSPYYGFACNTDPDVSFSPDGTAHYAVELYNLGGPNANGPFGSVPDPTGILSGASYGSEFVLATSHDGGLTWPDAVRMDVGDGIGFFHDYSRMNVNPVTKTIYTIWGSYDTPLSVVNGAAGGKLPADGVFISLVASRDNGKTADAPVIITGGPTSGAFGKFNVGDVASSPDGKNVVVGMESTQDGYYYFARSTDDGRSFSAPTKGYPVKPITGLPNTKFRAGSGLELAYDTGTLSAHRGRLYAVQGENVSGQADISIRWSDDNGTTWSNPTTVNTDAQTCGFTGNASGNGTLSPPSGKAACWAGHDQWMPDVAVTNDGTVHVLFMDRRWDPANRLIDLTYATSADGGHNWTNTRVTSQSFDGDLGRHQNGGVPFIGDYLGIDAAGMDVWGGFPDSLIGRTVIAAAHFSIGGQPVSTEARAPTNSSKT
ncbi:MAG: sialidase family protein [Thermoplasmatota archaeon]